jgi:FKBP-type peptidyl-prolyl cis-trans isomerase
MRFARLFYLLVLLAAPVGLRAQREKLPLEDREFVEKTWPEAKKTSTGIRYIVLREGGGETGKPGDRATVLYIGRLLNGTEFDRNLDREHPFTFRVARGMVIEGWEQIMEQMKTGEKRLVIIPAELAYGSRGSPPKIPRDATLVFEIEVLEFKHN